jgi:hypothetical protein
MQWIAIYFLLQQISWIFCQKQEKQIAYPNTKGNE